MQGFLRVNDVAAFLIKVPSVDHLFIDLEHAIDVVRVVIEVDRPHFLREL